MTAAPIDALTTRHGLPQVGGDGLDAVAAGRDLLLLLPGDPALHPEAADVAVILPELLRTFGARVAGAVAAPEAQAALAARFGVKLFPALVLLRDGACAGVITRVRGWAEYLAEISALLSAGTEGPTGTGGDAVATPSSSTQDHPR